MVVFLDGMGANHCLDWVMKPLFPMALSGMAQLLHARSHPGVSLSSTKMMLSIFGFIPSMVQK